MNNFNQELAEKPFTLEEHDCPPGAGGGVYIRKSALRRRLFQLDPAWSITPPEVIATAGDVVLFRGGLTLCGVTRYNVGTGIIQTTKKNKTTGEYEMLPAFDLSRNLAKAYKAAVSDLLPRCCVDFGIGAYLKDTKVKSMDELRAWLSKSGQSHWAHNGYGKAFSELMRSTGVPWATIAVALEPGKTLTRLSDTSLDFSAAILRLMEIDRSPVGKDGES